ncbi:hypothetical protein J3B02_000187 [Coemansia erecta]|nr:hypothetical protein J3B02_000187 [Coemansia erecta]
MLASMETKASASGAPEMPYIRKDYQDTKILGIDLKPDIAFFHEETRTNSIHTVHMVLEAKASKIDENPGDQTMGQILDYVYNIWNTQITRKFVPILLLHGPFLTLFAFTRNRSIRVEIGQIFRMMAKTGDDGIIKRTLKDLYFLLTLSPGEFGQICGVADKPSFLYFMPDIARSAASQSKGKSMESVMATVGTVKKNGSGRFAIEKIVDREVSLYGRVAYIATGKFDGEAAVLKLSWTSVDRLPENAAYEILLRDGIEGIPKMFRRGLLIEDFGGFRLEFVIMEDCGDSLCEALPTIYRGDKNAFTKAVRLIVCQTTASLISANISGIVHRDISDGNIAVRFNYSTKTPDARIIDWGYAKDHYSGSDESKIVGEKWRYDSVKHNSHCH